MMSIIVNGVKMGGDGSSSDEAITQAEADARYLKLTGGTVAGALSLSSNPTSNMQAATKSYVDTAVSSASSEITSSSVSSFNGRKGDVTPAAGDYTASQVGALPISGGTMTGKLTLSGNPTGSMEAVTKQYVDDKIDTASDKISEVSAKTSEAYDVAREAAASAEVAVDTAATAASIASDFASQSIVDATTTRKGITMLTDSVTSSSTSTAATPASVKTAYELASLANTRSSSAYDLALTANTKASSVYTLASDAKNLSVEAAAKASDAYSRAEVGWVAVDATTSTRGITMLVNSVTSTSVDDAATPASVKAAYDKAVAAYDAANAITGGTDGSSNLMYVSGGGTLVLDQAFGNPPYTIELIDSDEGGSGNVNISYVSGSGVASATGTNAFAAGTDAVSGGNSATATGVSANAHTDCTTAIGGYAYADGVSSAGSTVLRAATALGYNACASGPGATAIGSLANATSSISLFNPTAIGTCSTANMMGSTAVGSNSRAVSNNATAIGADSSATGTYSIAFGYNATAINENTIAIGTNAISSACNSSSIAIGTNANAGGQCCDIAIGYKAEATGGSQSAEANLNGRGSTLAIGAFSSAVGGGDIAIGRYAYSEGTDALAVGHNTCANGAYSVAIGFKSVAASRRTVAVGYNTYAGGNNSTAIGTYATTSNVNSIQLGDSANLSSITAKVAITVTSDARDKTDIEDIKDGAAEFLKKVRAVTFVYNQRELYRPQVLETDSEGNPVIEDGVDYMTDEDLENLRKYGFCRYDKESYAAGTKKGSRRRVGVIAQETQDALRKVYGDESYANLVNDNLHDLADVPDDVESTLAMNYEGFIPFLIKGFQEQDARIAKQDAQIVEQNERITHLEDMLRQLTTEHFFYEVGDNSED